MGLIEHLVGRIEEHLLLWPLFLNTFVTGMLDATSFGAFGVFSSNQTGNVIILISRAIGVQQKQNVEGTCFVPSLLTTGVSLAAFLTIAFVAGRISLQYGSMRRAQLCISSFIQSSLLLATAIILQTIYSKNVAGHAEVLLRNDSSFDALPVALLALSSGLQVSQARCTGVNEIPTAMLTSPMVDLLIHKDLFAAILPKSDASVRSRNIRAAYIVVFVFGIAFGALLHRFSGVATVTFVAFGLRLGTTFLFLL